MYYHEQDKHIIGQPIFGQLLNFVDKGDIRRLTKSQQAERYIKKLDGLTHFITMLNDMDSHDNLLLMLVRSKVKRQWAFSNMTSLLRGQLMSYINLYSFLSDPEKTWREKNETYKREMQLSIIPT